MTDSPERLPPVTVNCGRCSAQFLSRARHMMSVHCPRCGHSSRVKRWDAAGQHAGPAPAPTPIREPDITPVGGVGGGIVVDGQDDEDDEGTYIYDEHGRLVLAEWTVDGRLVPAGRPAAPVPARPQVLEVTWGDALAMLGWRLSGVIGGCQIVEDHRLCGMETTRRITGGWICGPHYSALCSVITRRSA